MNSLESAELTCAGFILELNPSWPLLCIAMAVASFLPPFFVVFGTVQAVNCQGRAGSALELWGTKCQEAACSFKAPKFGEMREALPGAGHDALCKALSMKTSDLRSNCIQSNPMPRACCTRRYRCQELLLCLQCHCVGRVTLMGCNALSHSKHPCRCS